MKIKVSIGFKNGNEESHVMDAAGLMDAWDQFKRRHGVGLLLRLHLIRRLIIEDVTP